LEEDANDEELARRLLDVVRKGDCVTLRKALEFMGENRRRYFCGYMDGYCDAVADMERAGMANGADEL
jgi:hypothetical protein